MGTGNMEFDNVQIDVTFSQASGRSNIASAENIALSFGKLSTWFAALVPEGGSSGQILGWNSSGTAKWVNLPAIPTVNDGIFSIKKGSDSVVTFSANQSSDTDLSFVEGSNVTITPNSTNRTVTIASVDEKVKVDKFVSTTQTDYLLTGAVASMATTAAHLVVDNADGVASARMRLQKGTTDTIGQSTLMLGNNIASGTSNNMQGMILMYSSSNKYGTIVSESLTNNRTWTLPDKTGTIAMTSDITPVNNGKLTIKGGTTSVAEFTANQSSDTNFSIVAGSNVTITPDATNSKITIASTDTDTKVTSADNHYAPATVSGQDKSASASGATAAWSIDVVKGVTLNTDGKGHVTGLSVTSGKIPANPIPSYNVTGNAAWTAADRILVTNAASGNVIKQSAYTIGATLNSGTANQLAYYSGANAISATHDGTNTVDSLYFKTGTNAKSARQIILGVYGQTYGNDASLLISGTAGVMSYGDGGPQIDFNTSSTGSQAGALIFTDHDNAATGASWHFVSNQTDWNVTSKRFHARTGISIGTDKPNTSYNLYVNGTSQFNGTATMSTNAFGTQLIVERSGSSNYASLGFKNNLGMLGYIGANAVDANLYHIYAGDTSKQYIILDTGNTSFTRSLSSGTKIGTIKIGGTSTDLYCQTNTDTDTKVNVTLATTSKAYLLGTTTTPTNTATGVTSVADTGVYLGTVAGSLFASSIYGSGAESQSTAPTGGYRIYDCRSVNVSPNDGDKAANFYFHMTDMPDTSLWWSVLHMRGWTGAYSAWEIAGPSDNKDQRTKPLYVRTSNTNTAWGSWRKIYDTSNPPTASEVGALASTTKYAGSSSVGGPALSVSTAGGDVVLGTPSSSSDDSGDIYWKYGNGQEKARLWQSNTYTAKAGPAYRIYKSDGTSLYNGNLPLADGTSASGTWGISITGNAATATKASTINTESGTSDGARPVFYAYLGDNTKVVYHTEFTYNPSTTKLSVKSIDSSLVTSTYLAGNKGTTIINSTAAAGSYVMLAKMNSSNGYFTHGVYQGSYRFHYTAKSTVDADTNNVTYSTTFGENGSWSFPAAVSIAGTLTLTRAQDGSGTADSKPALIVGGASTAAHLELDSNEIMAKATGTTTAPLYINNDGGAVYINAKLAAKFTETPTSGQVAITDGTGGNIKSSGYTIEKSVPSNAVFTDTDTKVAQTNTTDSAAYRVLLSGNANDTTETTTARKSTNLQFNPSTGSLTSLGFNRQDLTGKTVDINTYNLSAGNVHIMRFIEKTDGGAGNITNIPVTGKPFLLDVELIRWGSTTDYITRQIFTNANNPANSYVRYCTNGTWGSWTTRVFTNTTYTIATGDSNGQIKVTPSSGTAYNVSVKGLGSAAYTASSNYVAKTGDTMTGKLTMPASVYTAAGGALDMNNSDIVGANRIVFKDLSDSCDEGLSFYRSASTYDSFWIKNGVMYFTPNNPTDTTNHVVLHSGNYSSYALASTTKYAGSSSVGGAATSANKLNTNAGATNRPVYFSGGVPVQCDTPASGSWFKGVPLIGTDGVMEFGKIIDFHSTNTSTADYDLRLQYTGTATGKTVTLPGATGTVALLTKGSTSYWGMIDGDGGTTGWIRTTSNGLIAATAVSLANGGDGSLGTSSWAFKHAYIATVHGTLDGTASQAIKLRSSAARTDSTVDTADTTPYQKYWVKIASSYTTGTYIDLESLWAVNDVYGNRQGILKVRARVEGTAGTFGSTRTIRWLMADSSIDVNRFAIVCYNNRKPDGTEASGTATVELWWKSTGQYASFSFVLLDETRRTGKQPNDWVLYDTTTYGQAALPTTGNITYSVAATILNSTAGNAATATTATNATNAYHTAQNPTSGTTYGISFHASDNTSGNKGLLTNNGLRFLTLQGTTSALGYGYLLLGNGTASGTAGNKYGAMRFYTKGSTYIQLDAAADTSSLQFRQSGTTDGSNFSPATTNKYDIGTSSLKWRNIYATTFYGELSGNATTATSAVNANDATNATYSSQAYTTVTDGTTTATGYGILFAQDPSASEYNGIRKTNNFRISLKGAAAGSEGVAELVLGNSKAISTANNESGVITLYSAGGSWHTIKTNSVTSATTHMLPPKGGTLFNTGNLGIATKAVVLGNLGFTRSNSGLYYSASVDVSDLVTKIFAVSIYDFSSVSNISVQIHARDDTHLWVLVADATKTASTITVNGTLNVRIFGILK